MRDILNNTKKIISLEPQSVADNGGPGSDGVVTGSLVDRKLYESVVMELTFGTMAAAVTGGNLKLIPMAGDQSDGSDLAQVGTDVVQYIFDANNKKGVLRYNYTGTKRYVAVWVDNSLTGGAAGANTIVVSGTVLLGSPRYMGKTTF